MNSTLPNLDSIFKLYPAIKLVYLFGSQAQDDTGPLSDYDFAVYLDESDKRKRFDIKIELLNLITRLLKTDKVDVVILNDTASSELKYHIIKDGKLIYAQEPFQVLIEPKILNEYFDFHQSLIKYGLTKVS